MNAITETWRQMVRRKLWPLALLLVGALVAVPFLLAKDPATPVPTPVAHAAADTSGTPIVSLADASAPTERRRVLGQAKDPFAPAPLPKVKQSKKKKKAEATPTPTSTPTSSGGGSEGPASSPPPAGPEPTATPGPTVPKFSIKVNFGTTDGDPSPLTLARLDPLPSEDAPVLVYERVEDGGKVAVFSVPGSVTAEGDGKCDPSPENCATLKLRAGDTEFITVTDTGDASLDAQYQLELVKIYTKKTVVADAGADSTETP
jgi:hypothetical protein